ncbi:MAG: type II toxin-antitoxin system Phd/YefM family antitoxin [Dehalococcoidales bacterium]|nr:type II toxin-antitoxin system Phd/YefM family antitoxin [Dehalococcoidales bacterium]
MEKIKTIGIAEVRPKLTQLVDEVSRGGQPYTIISGSRAKAVLMGVNEYNSLIERLEDLEDIAEINQAVRNQEAVMSWEEHSQKLRKPDSIPANTT